VVRFFQRGFFAGVTRGDSVIGQQGKELWREAGQDTILCTQRVLFLESELSWKAEAL
jgi:hypothetical protein